MEKITTYNYEAFYLDYLEGNLDEIGQAMLFDFLEANPALKSELELDGDILDFQLNIKPDTLSKFEKEDLKHFDCKANEICLNNVNDFMVADVENEISAEKKVQLDEFVLEHYLQELRDYFYASKLKADLREVYPEKSELKKKGTIIPLFIKVASVAAVGFLIFNLVNGSGSPSEIYSPRNSGFALQVDTIEHNFKINTNSKEEEQDNFAVTNSELNKNAVKDKVENQSLPNDSVLIPVFDLVPNNDFVEDKIEDKKVKDEKIITPIVPVPEDFKDEIALFSNNEKSKEEINLVEMYQPITNLTNSYTNLGVSYKKSQPESEYAVTAFSIGKFSFERKKRK